MILFTCLSEENNNSSIKAGFASEQFPVFSNCESFQCKKLENCFYKEVPDFVFQNYVVPENLKLANYKGKVNVLFEVGTKGEFKVIYVNAGLSEEAKRIFGKFQKIKLSTYNAKLTYSKYTISIDIPLKNADQIAVEVLVLPEILKPIEKPMRELDSIGYKKYSNPDFESHLNIPFFS